MNYIYDILLNLQKEDFDFYDWNIDDRITHIRKVPLIKTNFDCMYRILNYDFSVSEEFIKRIINRTEVFSNKNIKIIKNLCLFSDGKDVIAVKFTNNGKKDKTSRLLLDEKEEVLDVANNIEETKIDITFNKELLNNRFKTRTEKNIYDYIQREMNLKNYEKLKYTYFECFSIDETDYKKIVDKLNLVLNNNWDNYYKKIYNILKLSSMNKSKN